MELEGRSTEELRDELKLVKGTSLFALCVLGIMIMVGIHGLFTHEQGWVFSSMLITPLIFINIGPKILKNIRVIQEEIKSRG